MVQSAIVEAIRKEWSDKKPYQSIFIDGQEIVTGHNRRDALQRMDAIRQSDITGKRVLVLGCNNGHDCFMVAERGASSVLGVDNNFELLDYAIGMLALYRLPVAFQYADLSQPFDAGPFDTVLAFAVYDGIGSADVFIQTLRTAGGVVYFEGHRKDPELPEGDYRALYGDVLSAFETVEPLCKTHDGTRWLYRLETGKQ